MSMFPSSLAAVLAAVAIQRELAAQDVPVRIGVHVGEVVVEPERLTGVAVNIAARIESFAVPGGVMLSDAAYDQIENRRDVGVVRLGRFRLKNVGRPFELYAVSADGIVVPDPEALEGKGERFASLPSNLPDPAAPLVGRAADLASLVELAREHRVVTITGPGGVGKTRIVVELGRLLAPEFLDGVAFVALADVTEPADFLPALADGAGREGGRGTDARRRDRLPHRRQEGAPAPGQPRAGRGGRFGRRRAGRELPRAADRDHQPDAAQDRRRTGVPARARSSSRHRRSRTRPSRSWRTRPVALFVERARTTKGSFELTPENAGAVAAVCRRLDGLPLALELAAARLRLLSPEALLERLDHALDVLTSGPRDIPERQQTLRATIDWSHSLLQEPEQRLFRRSGRLRRRVRRSPMSRPSAPIPASTCSTSWSRSSTRRSSRRTARATGSGCCRRSGSTPRAARGRGRDARGRAEARAPLCGARPRDPRRHRGHRPDRVARTRHRRGRQPPGRARHASGGGEGR